MRRALIVDDDSQVLTLTTRWFTEAGYAVDAAATFADARARIDAIEPDVLVVDVRLNGFNGVQLAALARARRPETRIVVISGFDDPVLRKEAERCGAAFLCKPLIGPQLLGALS
jgi:two-component system response regulator RegA